MPYYRAIADLEADLERVLRDRYGCDRWDFSGLFEPNSLAYWHTTNLSAAEILRAAIGQPVEAHA